MKLRIPKAEAERWEDFLAGRPRRSNTWAAPSKDRKQKAIELYLKYGSKSYVCDKLHMGRNTLNDILRSARVV